VLITATGLWLESGDVRRMPVPAEPDGTRLAQLTQVATRPLELGMRRGAHSLRVRDCSEDEMSRELDRCRNRRSRESHEVGAYEARKTAPSHSLRTDHVLYAETERIDQIAADADAVAQFGAPPRSVRGLSVRRVRGRRHPSLHVGRLGVPSSIPGSPSSQRHQPRPSRELQRTCRTDRATAWTTQEK
jgi:hypothetical protein